MSLAGNTYWNAAKNNSATNETWLIQLYYGDETNFIGISDRSLTIDSVYYEGIVLDFGDISNKIDLVKSRATTDNAEITVQNKYKNKFFTDILFGTSTYFINRKVKIYSRLGDTTSLSDCVLLDEFRLYNMPFDDLGNLKLQLEKSAPYDFISIPQTKQGDVYYPVTYGDFQPKGIDTVTGTNILEGNDSDMSSASAHQWEADSTDPPTFWDIDTTVSGKLYLALTASDLMGIVHADTTILQEDETYNVTFKAKTASGTGAKIYIGGHPAGTGTAYATAVGFTEATYSGTFVSETGATSLYIFAVADVGTATQAFEIDDISITHTGADTVTETQRMYPATYIPSLSWSQKFSYAVGATAASGAEPYFYDSNNDLLMKMTDAATATSSANGYYTYFNSLDRTASIRPTGASSSDWLNTDNCIDGDLSTFAYNVINKTQASPVTDTESITITFPEITENIVSTPTIYIKGSFVIESASGAGTYSLTHTLEINSASFPILEETVSDSSISDMLGIVYKTNGDGITFEYHSESATYGDVQIDSIVVRNSHSGSYSVQSRFKIYDAYFELDVEPDYSGDPNTEATEKRRVTIHGREITRKQVRKDFLYTEDDVEEFKTSNICVAIDGNTQGYTGGSGIAENVHEVYRDLLQRYTGFDVADASLDGWSDLDTDRSTWAVRWWQSDPKGLKKILDQLQYEGCFIFKFYQAGGKFIYVKDDPTGDVVHTITRQDITGVSASLSDFADVITHTDYNYQKHPAKGSYLSTATYTNSTSRTRYWASIASEENKQQVNLDFLVNDPTDGSSPNDCIALYYNNIVAEPKIIVNCDIINKRLFNLEDGDIVQFESSGVTGITGHIFQAYGKDFSDLYFMITKTKRSPNKLKIEAREVYTI